MQEESFKDWLSLSCKPRQLQRRDGGFILVRDCVCPVMQHWRALGLRVLDWGRRRGVRGWRWDQEWSFLRERGLGGCCTQDAAWPSRAIWPSPALVYPEGGWRTGGRGWWDSLDLGYVAERLASEPLSPPPQNTDPLLTKHTLSFVSGREPWMSLGSYVWP